MNLFKTLIKLPEEDGSIEVIDEGPHTTAGRVADLLPQLLDGTYRELTISVVDSKGNIQES